MRTFSYHIRLFCFASVLLFEGATQARNVEVERAHTVVETQSGPVRGVVEGDLIAFRGIPYATPPVGDLRWKAPQPHASWRGIRDASTFGNVCLQINFEGQFVGSEDCLTLNI